jgi:hypothetical protein
VPPPTIRGNFGDGHLSTHDAVKISEGELALRDFPGIFQRAALPSEMFREKLTGEPSPLKFSRELSEGRVAL